MDIARLRLHNQRLVGDPLPAPQDVVRWLGAVQAQDYAGAKWALAQRAEGPTDTGIDELFDAGAILRTHVMRPTWHFVAADDIRWIVELTAPRVHAASASHYRKLELDSATLGRGNALLAKVLRGGRQLTRAEVAEAFKSAGIEARGPRLGSLIMHAELEGVVCSGARRGKQHTYALLDERAPAPKRLERDEALRALAQRYFTAHGPALVQDFSWWSGLTVGEARLGIDLAQPDLVREEFKGKTYWRSPASQGSQREPTSVHLLPNYDEYFIAYKDRSSLLHPASAPQTVLWGHVVIVDGQAVGGWRRQVSKGRTTITVRLLVTLHKKHMRALEAAGQRYAQFTGMPVELVFS